MIDLDALKARLAEYDDARPRCQGKVARTINCAPDYLPSDNPTYPDYALTTYSPCCRPEGHADECRNGRSILGWPGFVTVSALVAEVERLRAEADEMRRWAEEAAHAENLNAQDARRVKEQIVAWLREPGEYVDPACARLADAIERGAYCREEKP